MPMSGSNGPKFIRTDFENFRIITQVLRSAWNTVIRVNITQLQVWMALKCNIDSLQFQLEFQASDLHVPPNLSDTQDEKTRNRAM